MDNRRIDGGTNVLQVAVDFRGRVNDLYGGCGIYVVIRTKTERVGIKADDEDQLSNGFRGVPGHSWTRRKDVLDGVSCRMI